MNLPPIYESFRKSGIRFVTNSPNGQFNTNCPKCGRPNTNFVELDADGLGFRCRCTARGCGFSAFERLRPASAKPEGNGGTPRDDDDAKRRAVDKRELGIEPEQEPEQIEDAFAEARERDFPDDDGAPGDDAEAQRKALEEARREFDDIEDEDEPASQDPTHVWRSKDHDYPCTPTGVEERHDDGRIYARVRTPDGNESFVLKDELIAKDEASFLDAALARLKEKKGLDFADLAAEISAARARGYDDVVRALLALTKPPPPPSLDAILERALKENPDGPFSEDLLEKFERLKREQPAEFARLCRRYPALAAAVALDATMVRAMLGNASKDEVVKLFIDLVLAADLNAVETDGLLRLAAKKANLTLRPLTSDLKQAKAEQAAQRAREERAKRLAARTDPRPMVREPADSDPFLPVMDKLNAVVGALIAPERPPRDIDGVSTRLRKLSVPMMHAFDQTQANAGDDDDD